MKPFLKWAGGKRQLIPHIIKYINAKNIGKHRYFEPFLGGGSVFFELGIKQSHINDLNEEIINCYFIIKNEPEELIKQLKIHARKHNKDYYYSIRELDRNQKKFASLSNIKKAARTIYLNHTCFNGLFRVNSKGFFNTPIGDYKNPLICDEENIRDVSRFLNSGVTITSADFEEAVNDAEKGDWIYFDPPYDYEGTGFVGYNKEGFSHDDLKRLKQVCDNLISKGCFVLISNNDTKFVRQLFADCDYDFVYSTKIVKANRNINSKPDGRKKVDEVLIYGRKK